jgi:hypothetical protein
MVANTIISYFGFLTDTYILVSSEILKKRDNLKNQLHDKLLLQYLRKKRYLQIILCLILAFKLTITESCKYFYFLLWLLN